MALSLPSRTLTPTTPMRHRNTPKKPEVTPAEARELRAILLQVVAALDARPSDFWDDLGRGDAALRHPQWLNRLSETLWVALEAAEMHGPGTLEATKQRVQVFFSALEALTLRRFEALSSLDVGAALVSLTEDSAEVTIAASRALHEQTDRNLETLRDAVMESEAQDEHVLALVSATLANQRCGTRDTRPAYR